MMRVAAVALLLIVGSRSPGQEPPKMLPNLSVDKPADVRGVRLPPAAQPIHLSCARGMDWLQRANQPDGKFLPGFLPALAMKADGDPFVPQTEAARALIRAARYRGDERALTLAKQSLLRLLQDTTTDASRPAIRFTSAPEPFVNRLAACGGLLQAIYELSDPPEDLRGQAGQLANYLRSQLQPDGTFVLGAEDPGFRQHLVQTCTGPALAGLRAYERFEMPGRNQDATHKAIDVHVALWRQAKNPEMVPGLTAACLAGLRSDTPSNHPHIAVVFEMNDWLLTLQAPGDLRQQRSAGGLGPWPPDKSGIRSPDATTGFYALALVDACRAARVVGDAQRFHRYRQALEQAIGFLVGLQYTEARVQHFAEWYRPWVLGGFHNGPRDGDLRLANTAHATAAMAGYLQHVVERE